MLKVCLKVLAWLYILYLCLCILIITPALNFMVPSLVKEHTGRQLHTDLIFVNPFSLAVQVRGARLIDPDGEKFVGFSLAEVNLSLASLWRTGWVLDVADLSDLYVHVRQTGPSTFNFSDMLPPPDDTPPPAEPTPLPGVTVNHLHLSAEHLGFTDLTREAPFHSFLEGVDIAVDGLSTVVTDGRPYELVARSEQGGEFSWRGTVSVPGQRSEGHLELRNLPLQAPWRFFEPLLNFELVEGRLSVATDYHLDLSNGVDYALTNGNLSIDRLATRARGEEASTLGWGRLALSGIAVDGTASAVDIEALQLDKFHLEGYYRDGRLSLAEKFAIKSEEDTGSESEPPTDVEASPWQIALHQLDIPDARIDWHSDFTDPPDLELTPVTVKVENLRWPAAETATVQLALRANDKTDLNVSGTLVPSAQHADLSASLTALPLSLFNPNLPEQIRAEIRSGELGAELSAALEAGELTTLGGDVAIEGFAVAVQDDELALTGWDSVRLEGITLEPPRQQARLEHLIIDGYEGRLHIHEDGTVNMQRALAENAESADSEAVPEAAPTENVEEPTSEAATPPWQWQLDQIQISNSALDFMDASLPLHFRTVIGDLHGEIAGLSSDPTKLARIDLQGSVDEYAPVNFAGTASPLADPPLLDLGLTFQGVDMVRLTPYSGTYAGHRIDSGLLNLDLRYALENHRLQGNNQVVISQLKLGDTVDSNLAVDLPLQLAIALLTDSRGVIDLEVPVSGNLDDPEFSLGGVIWGAFFNLITKAVTAPFTLLANLVGSDEDLQTVSFGPGVSAVNAAAAEKLDALAQALIERPQIQLGVAGRSRADTDGDALRKAQLRTELLAAGLAESEVDSRGENWREAIAQRYTTLGLPPSENSEPPSPGQMLQAVLAQISLPPGALTSLANERALETKRYLVGNGGIAADRVFLDQAEATSDTPFAGVELSVDI